MPGDSQSSPIHQGFTVRVNWLVVCVLSALVGLAAGGLRATMHQVTPKLPDSLAPVAVPAPPVPPAKPFRVICPHCRSVIQVTPDPTGALKTGSLVK